MAEEVTIGGSGSLFVGEDKVLRFELFDKANALAAVDMIGMTLVFDVRARDTSADPPILTVTPALSGVFNSVRATNTQRASVTLTDDQLNLFKAKSYRWSWKRLDAGSETVFAWGSFAPQKATAP